MYAVPRTARRNRAPRHAPELDAASNNWVTAGGLLLANRRFYGDYRKET